MHYYGHFLWKRCEQIYTVLEEDGVQLMPLNQGFSALSYKIHWPPGIALPSTIHKLVRRETLVHPFRHGPSSSWEGSHASLST